MKNLEAGGESNGLFMLGLVNSRSIRSFHVLEILYIQKSAVGRFMEPL